jgi:hypothetical protein
VKDAEAWKFQVSLKVRDTLINIRADTVVEMKESLRGMANEAAEILSCIASFSPPAPPAQAPGPVQAPLAAPPAQAAPPVQTPEIGPALVESVEMETKVSKKNGKPYTRFIVVIGGVKMSTFDTVDGKAAQSLMGKNAYFTAEKTPDGYYNLTSIRTA